MYNIYIKGKILKGININKVSYFNDNFNLIYDFIITNSSINFKYKAN